MKNITYTFNQIAAAIVLVISLCFLVFSPHLSAIACDVLKGTAGLSAFFLWGSTAGSQAKDGTHADLTNSLISQLAQSVPAPVAPQPASQAPTTEKAPEQANSMYTPISADIKAIKKYIDGAGTPEDLGKIFTDFQSAIGITGELYDYFSAKKALLAPKS